MHETTKEVKNCKARKKKEVSGTRRLIRARRLKTVYIHNEAMQDKVSIKTQEAKWEIGKIRSHIWIKEVNSRMQYTNHVKHHVLGAQIRLILIFLFLL